MRLHSKAQSPHHHLGVLGVDIFVDSNDHLAGSVHPGGGLKSLLRFGGMAFRHSNHPPVPTSAHLGTTNLQYFGKIAAIFEEMVQHHLAAGARDSVALARRQSHKYGSENRIMPVGNRFNVDDRT